MEQLLRRALFSARRRAISDDILSSARRVVAGCDTDDDRTVDVCIVDSLNAWGELGVQDPVLLSDCMISKCNGRTLGVTNGRRLEGTDLMSSGAVKNEIQTFLEMSTRMIGKHHLPMLYHERQVGHRCRGVSGFTVCTVVKMHREQKTCPDYNQHRLRVIRP